MCRVLIADDEDAIRRWLTRCLVKAGHEVEEVSNGNAAIAALHTSSFDLVLTDLKMAGSSGLDVLRAARALDPPPAVLVVTLVGSVMSDLVAIQIRSVDYIVQHISYDAT